VSNIPVVGTDTNVISAKIVDAFSNNARDTRPIYVDTAPPAVPELLQPKNQAATSATPVPFDWAGASDTGVGIRNYRIQIDRNADFAPLVREGDTTVSDTSYSLTDDTYFWRVLARDDVGNTSGFSAPDTFIFDTSAPLRINDLGSTAAVQPPDTGVYLSWNHGGTTVEYYNVYRSYQTSDTTQAVLLDTAPTEADTKVYYDGTVVQGDSYFYYVTAVDQAGNESDSSNTTTAPHLTVRKFTGPAASYRPGDTISYTIEYLNSGYGPARNVWVVDAVPSNTTLSDSATVLNPPPSATIDYSTDNGSTWQSSSYPRTQIDQIRWKINSAIDPRASGTSKRLRFVVIVN
jgi:uncharacterized repeat protein (TIGR01451 family)